MPLENSGMDTSRIELVRGDTLSIDFAYSDQDGVPINLTGASITFSARDQNDALLFALTVGDGITITDAAGGLASAEAAPVLTTGVIIPIRDDRIVGIYDIQITIDGNVATPALGELIIFRDVSRGA